MGQQIVKFFARNTAERSMNRILLGLTTWVVGFAAGVLLCSHVWVEFSRANGEEAESQFLEEQLALSNRAGLRGDHFAAALHALNAADAEAEIGFQWLKRSRSEPYWSWWLRPWREIEAQRLAQAAKDTAEFRRGRALAEASHHAEAAVSIERSTCPDLAASQWAKAVQLDPAWSGEPRRELERREVPNRSELQTAIDSAYIDSATAQELARSLSALRSRLPGKDVDQGRKSRSTSY